MNVPAIKKLRKKLAANEPICGLWITMESLSISAICAAMGLDWIVIDTEHGHLDWKEVLSHVRSAVRSDTVALVRVTSLDKGLIKRALDIGADGIIIPTTETVEELEQAVRFAHYPPAGVRGMGGEMATCWGQRCGEHVNEANDHVLVIPLIETVTAGKNIEQLCKVDGVEIMFLGPADYSASAGHAGKWDEAPGITEQLLAIKDTIRKNGKHCGVVTMSYEDFKERQEQGFRMLAIGMDTGLIIRGLAQVLNGLGRNCEMSTDLMPPKSDS